MTRLQRSSKPQEGWELYNLLVRSFILIRAVGIYSGRFQRNTVACSELGPVMETESMELHRVSSSWNAPPSSNSGDRPLVDFLDSVDLLETLSLKVNVVYAYVLSAH
jgi:hypothetical protein